MAPVSREYVAQRIVIRAQAGIQKSLLDAGLRRQDGAGKLKDINGTAR